MLCKLYKMKKIIICISIMLCGIVALAQEIEGTWVGTVSAGKSDDIMFSFKFGKIGDLYSTTVDIPAMRVQSLKPIHTTFAKEFLLVDGSNLGFRYEGYFKEDSHLIEGTFTEGVNSLRLVLHKSEVNTATVAEVKRPQEPIKPYPYIEETVTFINRKSGITLEGTLTHPDGKGIFPVVILISGSGPQDRDETYYEHKPFLVLADYLTRHGIAVLRYDDRGVGKSTGNFSLATTKEFACDVACAMAYLQTRSDIDKHNIGLIGHSEGAIIAPMVAHQSKKPAFIIMLAGTGLSGIETSVYLALKTRSFPVPDEAVYEASVRKGIMIAAAHKEMPEIRKELQFHYDQNILPTIRPLFNSDEEAAKVITNLIEFRVSPWNRYFYNYNAADELEKVTCPVLSLNGSKDMQVPAKINQDSIRKALAKGRNKDYLVQELPGLNHLFQECESGEMTEYSKIEQTIAPSVLELISQWIKSHQNQS
jgi:pimeloyl-ACP methyl ester carboxylesterase